MTLESRGTPIVPAVRRVPPARVALAFASLALLAIALAFPAGRVVSVAVALVTLAAFAAMSHRAAARDRARVDALRLELAETADALMKAHVDLEVLGGELSEAQRHFDLALQGSNDGVWEYDLRTRALYLSPGFRERLGLEPRRVSQAPLAWYEDAPASRRSRPLAQRGAGAPPAARVVQPGPAAAHAGRATTAGSAPAAPPSGTSRAGPVRISGSLTDIHRAALRRGAHARERGELPLAERRLARGHPQDRRARAVRVLQPALAGDHGPAASFEAIGEGWVDAVGRGGPRRRSSRSGPRTWPRAASSTTSFRMVPPDGTTRWVRSRGQRR